MLSEEAEEPEVPDELHSLVETEDESADHADAAPQEAEA